MVHALQLTHDLIRPGGCLVNVHDLPVPHVIEIRSSEPTQKVGWITDKEDYDTTRASLNAVVQVVADGLFILEDERNFYYNIYADNWEELQAFLTAWWESALIPERTIQHLIEQSQAAGETSRIVLALQARMTKLRAV